MLKNVMNIKLASKLCYSKQHLIRTNFEGPQEFVLKGVHCISAYLIMKAHIQAVSFCVCVLVFSRADCHTKKGGGRGWSVRRGSLLQDGLPVKFQDVKFKDLKVKEIFMRIDMKHSYFHNYVCHQFFCCFY